MYGVMKYGPIFLQYIGQWKFIQGNLKNLKQPFQIQNKE